MYSEFWEEGIFGGDGGSTEFRWQRGSVREEQNWDKGITKGGNNKIVKGQGQSDIFGKGSEGKARTGLNSTPLLQLSPYEANCSGKNCLSESGSLGLLSPVLFFTFKSTLRPLRPPIFLTSYHFLSIHVPTVIFLSPSFCFCSPLLICFCPTLSYYHAIDNHVVPFPHALASCVDSTSCSFDHSSPQTLISGSAPPPDLQTPLVFKPCIFFDTNQSDYHVLLLIVLYIPSYICLTSI